MFSHDAVVIDAHGASAADVQCVLDALAKVPFPKKAGDVTVSFQG